MTYSGAAAAKSARENLGRALAALQEDPNIPPDVLAVLQNIAQAVGSLFDAEKATSEPDGRASVKAALGTIGQTLALLQDVRANNRGIQLATETIAQTMGVLYPLTTAPSMRPPAMAPAQQPAAHAFAATAVAAPTVQAFQQQPQVAPQYQPAPQQAYQPAPAPQPAYQAQPQYQPAPAPQPAYQAQPQPQYQPAPAPQPAYQAPPQQAHPSAPQPQPAYQAQQAYQAAPQAQQAYQAAPQAQQAYQAQQAQPQAAPQPQPAFSSAAAPGAAARSAYRDTNKPRESVEVNIGANTESNFFVGFSAKIEEGGVFASTYNILARGTPVKALVTLPGGFATTVNGFVRFVRDPMDMATEAEPGMGIQFEGLDAEARDLILRFIKKRAPMFYDD